MAINFPSSPSNGQKYQSLNSPNYVYNGSHWTIDSSYVVNGSSGTGGTSGTSGTSPNNVITTGSFTGTQNISGSLNLTGSVTFLGPLTVNNSAGVGGTSEGGQINLALASSGQTVLTGSVVIDVYQNTVRIFEEGGNNRGVSIDLSKTPNSVGGDLIWKESGLVNAGTFVTLDNIKATCTSSGNRGLSLATISGTFAYNIGGNYGLAGGGGGWSTYGQTLTTTATTSIFGWGFNSAGDVSTYILTDTTNNRVYRITLQIGYSYNNNFISIERLH